MKNNYDKYIKEVWDVKEEIYQNFKKSKKKSFISFIDEELKDINLEDFLREKTIINSR